MHLMSPSHPTASAQFWPTQSRAADNARTLGLRSLHAMLPALLLSGVNSLILSGILRLLWVGYNDKFFSSWMETWLTAWPIAFPLIFVLGPLMVKLAVWLSKPSWPVRSAAPSRALVVRYHHNGEFSVDQ